jgi:hypothetical protein
MKILCELCAFAVRNKQTFDEFYVSSDLLGRSE